MYRKFDRVSFMKYFKEGLFEPYDGSLFGRCDKQAAEEAVKLMDEGKTIALVIWRNVPVLQRAYNSDTCIADYGVHDFVYRKEYSLLHLDAKQGYVETAL
jgi:hypothetical protein